MGLTEAELWNMTPRAFHNKLKGFKTLQDREEFRHKELVYTTLIPHVSKPADRKALFKDIFGTPQANASKKPKKPKKKEDPLEFWKKIDSMTAGAPPEGAAENKA